MRNSPISINVLVEHKVTSKNLIIYWGFLIYIFFSEVLPIWETTYKTFQHNIGTFEAPLSHVCKPNERFEVFESILKQSVQFLKMKGLKIKCKDLVSLCSSAAPLFLYGRLVFDAAFHHVTQPFWCGKLYYENIVFCICI